MKWAVGDEFVVPLDDGSFGRGQIIAAEPLTLMNSAICAFFEHRLTDVPADDTGFDKGNGVFSVLWVTRDLLDSGTWQVFAHTDPLDPRFYFPDLDQRRLDGFVGTKVYGSGIARRLVNAYFGLQPWDQFAEPDYLDRLLLVHGARPAQAVFAKGL